MSIVSSRWYVGLDLGQRQDYSAIAVIQAAKIVTGERRVWDDRQQRRKVMTDTIMHYHLRHLDRVRDLPYPAIVERVAALMRRPELVADATGVGLAVVDQFEAAGLDPTAVFIHGGDAVTGSGNEYRVPKRELVGVVQVGLQSKTLRVAAGLPLADVLTQELLNFRVKIDPKTAHDSYSAWREQDHDDLVLAVALALWRAMNPPGRGFQLDYAGNWLFGHPDDD